MSERRQNGFGTLLNKGKGKPWLAKWMFKGQTYYKSTGECDKKKAYKVLERLTRPFREEREEDVLRALQNRVLSLQETKAKEKLRIEDVWLEFEKTLGCGDVAGRTTKNYEHSVNAMSKWMKDKVEHADDITKTLAAEYLEARASSIGATSWNLELVLLKRVWKALSGEFKLHEDAWVNFKKKRVSKKSKRRTMSNEEIQNVLHNAETKDIQLLVMIGLYTGLRISDCALLKWKDIDFESNAMKVIPIKTKKHMDAPLEIPIHPALADMLKSMPKTSEYVSASNAKEYLSKSLSGHITKLFRTCGIETSKKDNDGKKVFVCGFHSLRHTFVSNAINSGMNPLLVQKIVGHSAVNMTEYYFHESIEKMTEGINAMPDVA